MRFISISFVLGLELCTWIYFNSSRMMRLLVIFVLFGGVFGAPNWRGGRQEGDGAEGEFFKSFCLLLFLNHSKFNFLPFFSNPHRR